MKIAFVSWFSLKIRDVLWAEVPWSLSGFQQQVALPRAGGVLLLRLRGTGLPLGSADTGVPCSSGTGGGGGGRCPP